MSEREKCSPSSSSATRNKGITAIPYKRYRRLYWGRRHREEVGGHGMRSSVRPPTVEQPICLHRYGDTRKQKARSACASRYFIMARGAAARQRHVVVTSQEQQRRGFFTRRHSPPSRIIAHHPPGHTYKRISHIE